MSNSKTIDLRQFPMFSALHEEDARLLAKFAKTRRMPDGATLMKSGQICSNIYCLLDCVVRKEGPESEKLGQGAVIGVVEVLAGQPVDADYQIKREGEAVVIPATAFEEILLLSPYLAEAVLSQLN